MFIQSIVRTDMFGSLLIVSLTSLFTLGLASLPLVINTWPFENAAAAGTYEHDYTFFLMLVFKGFSRVYLPSEPRERPKNPAKMA